MKTVALVVMLAALMGACGKPAAFGGSVRERIPREAGNFKLAGEIKPMEIAPPNKYREGALRPTEAATASYQSPGGKPLSLQVVNYASADDAAAALKAMQENVSTLYKQTRTVNTARKNKEGQTTGRRLSVENIAPQVHQLIWNDGSLLYLVSGDDLKSLTEFEQSLP